MPEAALYAPLPALITRPATLRAAPTPRCTTALTLLTTPRPMLVALLATLLMPDRTVFAAVAAKLETALVAFETVRETALVALDTALETRCPMLPRPHLCGLWPALIRVLKVETALNTWLCPRDAR